MEEELCWQFDLVGRAAQPYKGRSGGFVRKAVPLAEVMRKAPVSGSGEVMRTWRSLASIIRRAQGLRCGLLEAGKEM
eukprot:1175738-Pyramimonas_sp.AAC.1